MPTQLDLIASHMRQIWQNAETPRSQAHSPDRVIALLASEGVPDGYEPVKDDRGAWMPYQATKNAIHWRRLIKQTSTGSLT